MIRFYRNMQRKHKFSCPFVAFTASRDHWWTRRWVVPLKVPLFDLKSKYSRNFPPQNRANIRQASEVMRTVSHIHHSLNTRKWTRRVETPGQCWCRIPRLNELGPSRRSGSQNVLPSQHSDPKNHEAGQEKTLFELLGGVFVFPRRAADADLGWSATRSVHCNPVYSESPLPVFFSLYSSFTCTVCVSVRNSRRIIVQSVIPAFGIIASLFPHDVVKVII